MTREEAEALAAEYVLGTLDAESRARFASDLAQDTHLQALVADWDKKRFKPGDYHLAFEGATHPPLVSVNGALVFLRSELYDFAA